MATPVVIDRTWATPVRTFLLLVAVVLLLLAAFGVGGGWPVSVVDLGLAIAFASFFPF